MLMLVFIGLLCILQVMMLFILIALELNVFLKILDMLLEMLLKIKTNIYRLQANNSIM